MIIEINNKKSKVIIGGADNLIKFNIYKHLREKFSVLSNGYQHSEKYNTYKIKCDYCFSEYEAKVVGECRFCQSLNVSSKRLWDGRLSCIDKNLKFDTGLLPYVVSTVLSKGYSISYKDNRKNVLEPPKSISKSLKPWNLRDYQCEAVALFASNYLHDLYFPRGILKAATNAGKNSIIASTLLTYDTNSLILVHRVELFKQLVEFFEECGIEVNKFGTYKGKSYRDTGKITVAMYETLLSNSKKLNIKKYLKNIKLLVVDECHRASSTTYKKLIRQIPAFSVLFVSGTALPEDNEKSQMDILGQSGDVLFTISNKDLIDLGYSQMPIITMLRYKSFVNSGESYSDELIRQQFSQDKMKVLKEELKKDIGKQIAIVVEYIEHGKFILKNLIDFPCNIEFVSGEDKERSEKLERFSNKKTQILISSMILEEGVNIHGIEVGVNCFGGKSVKRIKQVTGRYLRHDGNNDTCKVIDFHDEGKWIGSHSEARLKIYEDEGFIIK